MLKESVLFVGATGLLIFFMTPTDKSDEAKPVDEQTQETPAPSSPSPDDAWGYDDEVEENGEGFVFGEPMTGSDSEPSEPAQDEEKPSAREEQSASNKSSDADYAATRNPPAQNGPSSGSLGSVDNPITLKSNNPANPVDD